jgi:hypothetical protein
LLPKDLEIFFPRVISSSIEPNNLEIETEYYAYPTLADLFLFQNPKREIWGKIFNQLKYICDKFSSRDYGSAVDCGYKLFIQKNEERLNQFIKDSPAEIINILNSKNLRINGRPTISLEKAFETSKNTLIEIANTTRLTPIHGDLCFSNILCEPNRGLMKLIDPRGSFGDKGILGDPRYDLAKIHHSAVGLYDYIVNDLFNITVKPSNIEVVFPKKDNLEIIQKEYIDIFYGKRDKRHIDILAAWLFLSMLPLHSDSNRRQLLLALRGLDLLTTAFK